MKKIIVSLFCILFLQNVYAGDDNLLVHSGLGSEVLDYADDKLDESAIRALCVKLVQYASTHDIDISELFSVGGQPYSPKISDCKERSIDTVSGIIKGTSITLMHTYPIHHDNPSSCQDAMKKTALSQCAGRDSSYVSVYTRPSSGLYFDFDDRQAYVECSESDNRCVVNRPVSRKSIPGQKMWYSVCCTVPIETCNEEKTTTEEPVIGYRKFVNETRALSDFDYDCRPINQ